MSEARFIPTIGERGFYDIANPFRLEANTIATCKSIRKISELLSSGVDVLADYYVDNGLDETLFEEHQVKDIEIVSLLTDGGRWVTFPVTYLRGYPNMNGVPYQVRYMVIPLPPFPLDQSFDHAVSQLKDVVKDSLGVDTEVKVVTQSDVSLVETSKHTETKTRRLLNSKGTTTFAQMTYWRTAYLELKRKFDILAESFKPKP